MCCKMTNADRAYSILCTACLFATNSCYSLALEKLRIHLRTKGKLLERKNRKYDALQRKYLQEVQQKVVGRELSGRVMLQNFLDRRREIAIEIDTRYLEDERRKAKEELDKVCQSSIELNTTFDSDENCSLIGEGNGSN